ncbi:MAG: NeuD/PglB/VioB family sugar acetyltransferase [Mariniphaga sp.]
MKKIIIWGATGHSIVLEEILSKDFEIIAIFDNNVNVESPFESIKIYNGENGFTNWLKIERPNCSEMYFTVAIGGSKGKDRTEISKFLKAYGMTSVDCIHNTASVGKGLVKGEGCHILANSTIGVRCKIDNQVIINTASSIDHECTLGNGVHIGPGATLAGCIEVGDNTFIGTGASILPRIKIGSNSIVGAGAVVTKDIPDNVIAYGNPAKVIRNI